MEAIRMWILFLFEVTEFAVAKCLKRLIWLSTELIPGASHAVLSASCFSAQDRTSPLRIALAFTDVRLVFLRKQFVRGRRETSRLMPRELIALGDTSI
jgi:hypothetical protein